MEQKENTFRDGIATVDEKGKRVWVFPKKPNGRWYNKRKWLSYFFLAFLFAGPYIKIGGEPLLLLNILERKFVIFGKIFWPQDFHLFAIAMVTGVIFIALFTVVYGRLFCGWVCPQTIFMEMLFRRIEYAIEGDWNAQKRLRQMGWNREKIIKKASKHTIFWFISFLIANTFLAYIIGYEELFAIVTDSPANHIGGLIAIVAFTTVFYFVFSKFREQVCTVVCPYGRLQGALLDNKSMIVAYDHVRGEDRGKIKRGENRSQTAKGDCIDCAQCVHVCPTGIDIRNGTQLECINCTACIDACDEVMDKVGFERGLVRYASEENIREKTPFKFSVKAKAYSVLLVGLMVLLTGLIASRSDFEATVLRTRGTLYQEIEKGKLSNIYDINIVNKTNEELPVTIKIIKGEGEIRMVGKDIVLPKQEEVSGKFMIVVDDEKINKVNTDYVLGVYSDDKLIEKVKTTFMAPML